MELSCLSPPTEAHWSPQNAAPEEPRTEEWYREGGDCNRKGKSVETANFIWMQHYVFETFNWRNTANIFATIFSKNDL